MKFKNLSDMTDIENMPTALFPDVKSVADKLTTIADMVTDRHLTDEKAAEILNDALKDSNIVFRKSSVEDTAESRLEGSLYDRSMYRIGDIYKEDDKCVIEYLPGFAGILNKPASYKIFVKFILPCIGHEMIHVLQGVVGGVAELSERYLMQSHELMAFAYVAAAELYRKYKGSRILMKNHVNDETMDLKTAPHFTTYVELFGKKNRNVLDKFKKYVLEYAGRTGMFDYLN